MYYFASVFVFAKMYAAYAKRYSQNDLGNKLKSILPRQQLVL